MTRHWIACPVATPNLKGQLMTTEEKIFLAASLIRRKAEWIVAKTAEIEASTSEKSARLDSLTYALYDIDEVFDGCEAASDAQWMRDFFTLTGDHAVLTEDGWMEADQAEGYEILDQINAPPAEVQ